MKKILWFGQEKGRRLYWIEGSPSKWEHPWQIKPFYSGAVNGWRATVRPGFVNGETPMVRIPKAMMEEEWAKKYAQVAEDNREMVDLPLWDDVEIPLTGMKRVTSSIPQLFAELGVRDVDKLLKAAVNIDVGGVGGVTINTTALEEAGQQEGERILWWTEVFLSQARATYGLDVDIPANVVTGQLVEYTVTFNTSRLQQEGARARLRVGEMPKKTAELGLMERMQGNVGDDGEDRIRLAKIYFLSPLLGEEDVAEEMEPTGSWQAFVGHEQCWNMCHGAKNDMPRNVQQSGLDPALAFFLGRYVAPAAVMGSGGEAMDRILTGLLNSHDNAGVWWSV